ncbi:MAG TPA: sulfotransferase [Fibrobacteria bacterium]|nr:sulfotransferase [Fibrobacteria bacterium]
MSKTKCIIILSEKSSGSSACQNLIHDFTGAKFIAKTRHFENETLYWVKAASILGMEQLKALNSEVPIPPRKARRDLIRLLLDNAPGFLPPKDDRELIFGGWKSLCESHQPIFLEKSPHHLYQWSALNLIMEFAEKHPEIDFLVIGLIRNPMDTLYSQFSRWRSAPKKLQFQWMTAYQNLRKLKGLLGDKLMLVRYEDMVDSLDCMLPIFRFCGLDPDKLPKSSLHRDALSKWKKDKRFGFILAEPVKQFARSFGYTDFELDNTSNPGWPFYEFLARISYKAKLALSKMWFWRQNGGRHAGPGAKILNGPPGLARLKSRTRHSAATVTAVSIVTAAILTWT